MNHPAELPASWQKPEPVPVPDVIVAPTWNADDPAQLGAWFGNYGHWEHWRKVVLSSCGEVLRAKLALDKQPVTETRLNVLAHLHPAYLEFLTDGLSGRTLWEAEVQKKGFGS